MYTTIRKWFGTRFHRRRPHVLYFLHLPKTCGYTAFTMLASRFPPDRTAAHLPGEAYLRCPPEQLDEYDYIAGHLNFGRHLPTLVSRPVKTFVLMREPRAQVLSNYKYVLEKPFHPHHEHAKRHCPTIEAL